MTQRIIFYQVWNRKCVFHCPLMRNNVKVDDVHWMKILLAEWVFMMPQKNLPRSYCSPLPGVLKNTHLLSCYKGFSQLFYGRYHVGH